MKFEIIFELISVLKIFSLTTIFIFKFRIVCIVLHFFCKRLRSILSLYFSLRNLFFSLLFSLSRNNIKSMFVS